jgi:hypothetical protein
MVNVLTIKPKVCWFKPGRGDKNAQHIFLQGELKPEAPCHKILRHVKKSLASMNKNTSQSQILLVDSAGRTARELWWTNQEFSSVDFVPPWF